MGILADWMAARHGHVSIVERYTEDTQRVLKLAQQEALRRGQTLVTPADLLAGLMEEENHRATRIGSLKQNATYLRWLVELPQLPMLAKNLCAEAASTEFDAEARRALAYMALEADRDREYWVDTDHLLRGLLCFPNLADFAILKTEIDLHSLRHRSRVDRDIFPSHHAPKEKTAQYLVRKYVEWLAPPLIGLTCYLYILIEGLGSAFLTQAH
jgi:ATP-dependent Clp protease ATP-binding subunit ClpA